MSGYYKQLTKQQEKNANIASFVADQMYRWHGPWIKQAAETDAADSHLALSCMKKILTWFRDTATEHSYIDYKLNTEEMQEIIAKQPTSRTFAGNLYHGSI